MAMRNWEGSANAAMIGAVVEPYDGHFCVAARHLQTGEEILYNARELCSAASVFKVPVLVELVRQAENGTLSLDESYTLRNEDKCLGSGHLKNLRPGAKFTLRQLAKLMITVSDNTAADLILKRVGAANVTRTLHHSGLANSYVTTGCRGLMAQTPDQQVKAAPENNTTTPLEMVNLLSGLYRGTLLSPRGCQTVLEIMKQQSRRWRIPAKLPSGVVTATKSGTLPRICNDIGIVWINPRTAYAVAIFSQWLKKPDNANQILADISLAIYRYFTQASHANSDLPIRQRAAGIQVHPWNDTLYYRSRLWQEGLKGGSSVGVSERFDPRIDYWSYVRRSSVFWDGEK